MQCERYSVGLTSRPASSSTTFAPASHNCFVMTPPAAPEPITHTSYFTAAIPGIILEITPLHLNREWARLLQCGGHYRKTKAPRPLSRKTVRHVAGLLSSAFSRAAFWGLVTTNPVKFSQPPVPKKHRAIALTVAQQE